MNHRFYTWLFSRAARPLRFICTGGIAAVIQLGLLDLLVKYGWEPVLANAIAFLLSAQVNFLLSFFFTWRDRQPESGKSRKDILFARWITFHSSILGSAVLNQLIFVGARSFFPALVASALGICVASLVNFFMMNSLVFRSKKVVEIIPSQPALLSESNQMVRMADDK